MNAEQLLEHAAGLVTRRRREYGEPIDLFEHVARRWSLTLGIRVSPAQVVLCLIDLKLARLSHDPKHWTARSIWPATPPACERSPDDRPPRKAEQGPGA